MMVMLAVVMIGARLLEREINGLIARHLLIFIESR